MYQRLKHSVIVGSLYYIHLINRKTFEIGCSNVVMSLFSTINLLISFAWPNFGHVTSPFVTVCLNLFTFTLLYDNLMVSAVCNNRFCTCFPLDDPRPVTANFLRDLMLNKTTVAVWKPCLFSVCGLPQSGRTELVDQLLANIKPPPLPEVGVDKHGMTGRELIAVDIKHFKGLHYAHSRGDKTYRYATLSALGHHFVRHGKKYVPKLFLVVVDVLRTSS